MPVRLSSEYRALKKIAKKHKWTVRKRSKHLEWRPPNGPFVITSATPSDPRSLKNAKAALRRADLPIPHY
ncbi:hypothetical protein GCM10009603_50090 [Nocardiopsis exhalans]